jgi:ankyrin repeat protein
MLAALGDRLDRVLAHVGPRFFGHLGGGPPGTILHHAAWNGNARATDRLLAAGADPVALSGAEWDTPAAWAALGSRAHEEAGHDYVAVMERLVAAGAVVEPRFEDVAEGPLADWLA